MRRQLFGLIGSFLLLTPVIHAQDIDGKFGLRIHLGAWKSIQTDHSDIWTIGPLGRFGIDYAVADFFTIGVAGGYRLVYEANLVGRTKGAGFTFDKLSGGNTFRNQLYELTFGLRPLPHAKIAPYFANGVGFNFWQVKRTGGTLDSLTDRNGNSFKAQDKELTLSTGLGVELFPTENLAIDLGGRYHYRTKAFSDLKGAKDVWDAAFEDLPRGLFETYIGLVVYFGKPKDADRDGVPDRTDKCPGTPAGCQVDALGCSIDSDGDGVCDGVDQCPSTPKGCKADAKGCPSDLDHDGVCDGLDRCADTPLGARVDVQGCPIDSDGDGVPDGIDQCADTPKGCKVDGKGCTLDTDNDGVCDGIDRCPSTPAGATVDAKGCELDGDKDGVPDGIDHCPGTPVGCVVDATGCSVDTDGDGVCDGLDKCPNTPKGRPVDLTGCEFVLPTPEKPLVLEGVHFETGKALLTEDSKQILARVAASLLDHPEVKLEVAGHTDATGSDAHNLKLSQARANAVRNYLISKGVKAEVLTAKGYGKSQPIADNQTKEGRDRNRRTELRRLP